MAEVVMMHLVLDTLKKEWDKMQSVKITEATLYLHMAFERIT